MIFILITLNLTWVVLWKYLVLCIAHTSVSFQFISVDGISLTSLNWGNNKHIVIGRVSFMFILNEEFNLNIQF